MPLLCRIAIPVESLLIILLYAFAKVIHPSKVKLGDSMPLFGRHAIPFHGFIIILLYIILLYAPIIFIHHP